MIAAGRPSDEPAAIVQWAWTAEQRGVAGTLTDLPTLAAAANIGPPATLVVGEVAALPRLLRAPTTDFSEDPQNFFQLNQNIPPN